MKLQIILAIALVASLTPLVLGSSSVDTKLLTLYATGAGVFHAVFYCRHAFTFVTDDEPMKFNYNWFAVYILIAITIPMSSNIPAMLPMHHSVVIVALVTGLLINNLYLVTGKTLHMFGTTVLYTMGLGHSIVRLLGLNYLGEANTVIMIVMIYIIIALVNHLAVGFLRSSIRE